MFGNFVKAVVDIETEAIALYGELHADEESILISRGSKQEDLWGINLYPENNTEEFIEFDSMINLRQASGNMSRGVDDKGIRNRIIEIINKLIKR